MISRRFFYCRSHCVGGAAAANAAVEAASTILSQSVKGSVADDLLAKGIAEVRAKLN